MTTPNSLSKSGALYEEAKKVLPGGISRNTIFRRPNPDYAARGEGCRVTDIDGTSRVDFANNMASLIHGHAHPDVVAAVSQQLQNGTAFTMATESELRFAQHLCSRNPGFEKIRFMNSGTEAVMVAIKAARAFTGRPKIAKSEGAYHGTYDYAEVSQISTPENWGPSDRPVSVPVSQGTPQNALNDVIVFPFNNLEGTLAILNEHAEELACVLIDPLPHRVGLIPATKEYIAGIRKWTEANHCLFIMDEVITFRMGYGGAQDWYEEQPDLTAMGKIIGGGFPVGAIAGSDRFMSVLDPTQSNLPLPHSGTFSANPVTMTAGRLSMELFDRDAVYRINRLGELTRKRIAEAIANAKLERKGMHACVTGGGSMFRVHLKREAPAEYRSAYQDANERRHISFLVNEMYQHGFMMINTCSGALSTAITEVEIDALAENLEAAFKKIHEF